MIVKDLLFIFYFKIKLLHYFMYNRGCNKKGVLKMILNQIDQDLLSLANQSDQELKPIYDQIDEICLHNSNRILE